MSITRNEGRILLVDLATDGHHWEYAIELANYLSEHGYSVGLMLPDFLNDPKLNLSVERFRVQKPNNEGGYVIRFWSYVWLALQSLRVSKKHGYPNIHYLYLDVLILPLYFVASLGKYRNIRVYATLHWISSIALDNSRNLYRILKNYCFNRLSRTLLSKVFVHGTRSEEFLLTQIPASKIERIPYGTRDVAKGELYDIVESRRLLNLPLSRTLLLVFGGMRKDKGLDILARALCQLSSSEIGVIIAGDPAAGSYSEEQIRSLFREADAYFFLRYIAEDEIPCFFRAADAVILPYRPPFSGQSGPLALSVAYRRPLIVTDVGELGETVRKYGLGWVCRPCSSSIQEALMDFLLDRKRLGNKLEHNFEAYLSLTSWRKMSVQIVQAYELEV